MNKIKTFIAYLYDQYHRYTFYKRDCKSVNNLLPPPITASELKNVNEEWAGCKQRKSDLLYSRVYKKIYGNFPRFFVNDYQRTELYKKTNPARLAVSLEHKALYDVYFPLIPTPTSIVKQISGTFYDENGKIITLDACIKSVKALTEDVIIKPTTETGCGKGVKKITPANYSIEELRTLFLPYKGDFIVQKLLTQCEEIQRLNPTSINSCRLTTVFLNGRFGYSSVLKVGKLGEVLDNWKGSYFVGMQKDGSLNDFGIASDFQIVYQTDNGIPFKGIKVPCFDKIVKTAETCHKLYFPHLGIVGWDILIDADYNVKVIEMNLVYPGILGEQLASGPFLSEFKEEINELLKR